jgi:hypothetical protein
MRHFNTYPKAPRYMQACTKSQSEWTVKYISLARLPDSFNFRPASIPLRIGMEISVTITSGCKRAAALYLWRYKKGVLVAIKRSNSEGGVVLEWNTDERGYWILCSLCEVFCLGRFRLLGRSRLLLRGRQHDRYQKNGQR